MPIVGKIFKGLPDKGYSFSRTFGLLLVTYVFWMFCSIGISTNSISGILFSLLVVAGISIKVHTGSKVSTNRDWIRKNLSYLVSSELVFLVCFLVFAWFKANSPDISGTEKPMEFMFINSILQSINFPPHDAWLSGYAISYYHFGYIMVATLAKLTGISSSIAFNLGLITIFSLSAQCAFGLTNNLISKAIPTLKLSILPSLLAPLLILIIGNLYGVLDVLNNNGFLTELKIPVIVYDYPDVTNGNNTSPYSGVAYQEVNIWEWLDIKRLSLADGSIKDKIDWNIYNWFFASRIIHDRDLSGNEVEVIDEFPAFSFLLGDLHPHVLSLPFVIVVMGYAFAFLNNLNEKPIPVIRSISDIRKNISMFGVIGLLLGGLSFLNFWDFPIYFFIFLLVYFVSLVKKGVPTPSVIKSLVIFTICSITSSVLLYLPFYISFQSQAGGILPNLVYATRTNQFLLHLGPQIFVSFLLVIWLTRNARGKIKIGTVFLASFLLLTGLTVITLLLSGFIYSTADPSVIQAQLGAFSFTEAISLTLQKRFVSIFTPLILSVLFGLAFAILFKESTLDQNKISAQSKNDQPGMESGEINMGSKSYLGNTTSLIFILLLLITSSLLLIGPDFLYLGDNFGTRMNTVFKFYYQSWIQLGIIGAFSLWFLVKNGGPIIKIVAKISGTAIILMGLIYTGLSANTIIGPSQREPTLDGMEFFSIYYPDDWNVIQWLKKNANSDAVVLEGTMGAYWVEGRSSRISMGTGLQTVMGWANHEAQWRGIDYASVAGRLDDIRLIYQTSNWDEADRLLEKYNVIYVVISPLEEQWYGPINIHKFDKNLQEVFRSGDVTVYQRIY